MVQEPRKRVYSIFLSRWGLSALQWYFWINGKVQYWVWCKWVNEWRLFIDSSKRSLKAVLLHNGSKYASVPVGHSVHLKESYENLALVLTKLNYKDRGWMICGDLKLLSVLLGQQSGYTKYPCFLCEWDSTAKSQHWAQNDGPVEVFKTTW
jgi:hypothetical protein